MRVLLKPYDVVTVRPDEVGYASIRDKFSQVVGSPPMTGIALPKPRTKKLTTEAFLIARYCLDRILDGQTCMMTNYGPINVELMFEGFAISGYQQIHLLAHLILAHADRLTDQPELHDRLLEDSEGVIMWFSAGFSADVFRRLVAELQVDLKALLDGLIQGRIAQGVFQ